MLAKIILLLLFIHSLHAESLDIKNFVFITENDADFRNDNDYTYGSEIGLLFYRKNLDESFLHIPFSDYKNQDNYLSFSYGQKIYTPKDLEAATIIKEDRPYAGYMYIKSSLHQATKEHLHSLSMQVGMIGPSVQMDKVQEMIHSLIGSDDPMGWNFQLKNELILQLNYAYKKYVELSDSFVFIPEYGFDLGNASTKVYTAGLIRWGQDLPQDFGSVQMDSCSFGKIPHSVMQEYKDVLSYSFSFWFKANLVGRDIFLDGNTFQDSHSVEKKFFVAEAGYGLSLYYGAFSIEYLRKHLSKEFKTQEKYHNYGSLFFSYNF